MDFRLITLVPSGHRDIIRLLAIISVFEQLTDQQRARLYSGQITIQDIKNAFPQFAQLIQNEADAFGFLWQNGYYQQSFKLPGSLLTKLQSLAPDLSLRGVWWWVLNIRTNRLVETNTSQSPGTIYNDFKAMMKEAGFSPFEPNGPTPRKS